MGHQCPHCGAPLPEGAGFCPHCAQIVGERKKLARPVLLWKKLACGAAALVLLAAVVLGGYYAVQPKVYDSQGEVFYSDRDGNYQLVLAWPDNRCDPIYEMQQTGEPEEQYRVPCRLYINYKESGADARETFLPKVESITTEILQEADSPSPMTCTEPAPHDYSPDAAMVTFLDFTGTSGRTQLVWTISMKNGDVIRLRQDEIIEPIKTYTYDYHDIPMDTIEELQALVDQVAQETEDSDVVNIYLPPVTYEGSLSITQRPVNLYGSVEEGHRTTFTDTIGITADDTQISYFYDIDFVGDGTGIGVSSAARARMTGCRFTGWKTGFLGYGYAWVNVIDCTFTDNQVGFHFNSTGNSASHSMYDGNQFLNNGTAVLLENVPTDLMINFSGSVFSGNQTDIDNRCNQPLDLSQAVFQDEESTK